MGDREPILNDTDDFEIDFQDFGNSAIPNDVPTIPTTNFNSSKGDTDYKFAVESDSDSGNIPLESDNSTSEPPRSNAFWSFEFYQQYFNVNDEMVLERLLYACLPLPNTNYLDKLKPLPDFYGPLWVCITLIFSTAISGNLADFFQTLGEEKEWEYDFKKVTIAATVVFTYVTAIPALLTGYLWWRKSNTAIKLIDTLSLYGYSLTVFIPISILLCINHEWIRWLLVLVIIGTSGVVLTLTLWNILSEEPKQLALIITAVLAALHLALILLFKMYFFASTKKSVTPVTPTSA